jgi:hypothetical protein
MGLAAMQQIAKWLEKLGLSEYAQLFAENHIDLTLLRDLTDVDLKELGVAHSATAERFCARLPSLIRLLQRQWRRLRKLCQRRSKLPRCGRLRPPHRLPRSIWLRAVRAALSIQRALAEVNRKKQNCWEAGAERAHWN